MSLGALVCAALVAIADIPLEGTQPRTLQNEVGLSTGCNCHSGYSPEFIEPVQTWAATPMSLSARDPLFRAALAVAHRDRPELSPTCIRCHAPVGWLGGRSSPGDGSALEDTDRQGVTCDVCHRMVPGDEPLLIGDGQMRIDDSTAKRGQRGNMGMTGHPVVRSDYTASSELCGVCHSLFNPLEGGHHEQRTYEEWADSAFEARNTTCIECHMKKVEGHACRERDPARLYSDLRHHSIVGGNLFLPKAVAALEPDLGLDDELLEIEPMIRASLASAVKLTVGSTHAKPRHEVAPGEQVAFTVRVENRTGHKLPTGYPEGRAVYLEVSLDIEGRTSTVISGRWDPLQGDLQPDPQLRVYDTGQGRDGTRSRNLALTNQVLWDTRIPPEGFTPRAEDMRPKGRDYGERAPYRHWDEAPFAVPIPADVPVGGTMEMRRTRTGTITVRAMYQVTSGAYVRFLRESMTATQAAAARLDEAWEATGRAPPIEMARVTLPILVRAKAGPTGPPPGDDSTGCSCAATSYGRVGAFPIWILALAFLKVARRLRRTPSCVGRSVSSCSPHGCAVTSCGSISGSSASAASPTTLSPRR